uniref:leucine-rich repeat-containing protein 59 n=1 Tax=Myxine glutinosa TaxID=7769 RepID=UPI00358DF09E
MPKKSKMKLRDKLEGNELDLSLSVLTEVPVKELMELPKATTLDLSCNLLVKLQEEFCMLTHVVKIDLSKNQLQELPMEFGRLRLLQHLDLYDNQLQALPISFADLKSLKWLDLKDNPLGEELATVATDCLDDRQCKLCASKVVIYMKELQEVVDREKQKRLEKEQAQQTRREARQRRREEQQREILRQKKAEEKEQRKRAYEEEQAKKQSETKSKRKTERRVPGTALQNGVVRMEKKGRSHGCALLLFLFLFLMVLLAGVLTYCLTCSTSHSNICHVMQDLHTSFLPIMSKRCESLQNFLGDCLAVVQKRFFS